MKKNTKVIIVILIIFAIYGLIMYLMFKNNTQNNQENSDNNSTQNNDIDVNESNKYLILGNISNWLFKNNKWSEVTTSTIESSNTLFKVEVNNNYLGEYYLKYGKAWNLFDSNTNFVNYNGSLIAYSDNFNVNTKKVTIRTINDSDKSYINTNFNISNFDNLISNEAIDVDLDNDGTMDEIICLSNFGDNDIDKDKYYNLVFVKFNNQIFKIIYENSANTNILQTGIYNITSILNVENQQYFDLIIKKSTGIDTDSLSEKNIMYEFDGNNFNKIMSD